MNIPSFLQCLTINGIITGNSIQGIYNFSSGDSNIIYNQLYTTGSMYISGIVSTLNTPLISVGQPISSGYFSGIQNFRIGYTSTNDFALLLDVQFDSCSKLNLVDYCLLSSNTLNNSGKNFTLTINDANRITLKTSGGYYCTVSQELTEHDFVYFSLNQHQYITVGVFNVAQNTFYNQKIDLGGPILNSDVVYIGSEFNSPTSTGFFGTINNAVLFNETQLGLNNCVGCYFTTGFGINNNTITANVPQITGFYYSGIQSTVTNTGILSGNVPKINGSNVSIEYFSSSISGITSGLLVTPLYRTTGVNVNQPTYQFYQDTGIVNSFNKFELAFENSLMAGDALEIYTYSYPIPNVGIQLIGDFIPNSVPIMQLVANGVEENINIDYTIVRNQVSGFFQNDVLAFDSLNSQAYVVNFSGTFNNIFTGNSGSNAVLNVTGLSGVCFNNIKYPTFGYDVYLNGQKLISGYEYGIQNTGISGFNVAISGSEILNPNGSGIDMSELTFVPQFSNIIYFLSGVTQTTTYLSGIVGFSEQVWVNGIRQNRGIDYNLVTPCSTQSGTNIVPILPFLFYNNNDNWNFTYPPVMTGCNIEYFLSGGIHFYLGFDWGHINLNNYPSGNYIELYRNSGNGDVFVGMVNTSSTGYFWDIEFATGIFCIKTRYHNGNIIGDYSNEFCQSVI